MKKRCTSPSKLCSLNCVTRRLVPGDKALPKQVAEDVSGVTKTIHNLKDNTQCDTFTNPAHSTKNHRKTTSTNQLEFHHHSLQSTLVWHGAVFNCYTKTAARVQTAAREYFSCLPQKLFSFCTMPNQNKL